MNTLKARILVVEDEPALRGGLQAALQGEGHVVDTAEDGAAARRLLEEQPYDLVLSEVRTPPPGGLQLLRESRQAKRDTPFILMAANGSVEQAVQAMKAGACDYLTKPVDPKRLGTLVTRVLARAANTGNGDGGPLRQVRHAEPEWPVGESEAIRRVVRAAEEVARSEASVLIEGENGVGKEFFARFIHARSGRGGHPFVGVDCAALPEALAEAEPFGHRDAATSGADNGMAERFRRAHGGTLFFDEIGSLGASGQAELLGALDHGDFRGSVRIVAATSGSLSGAVAAGAFRTDLLRRLQIVRIGVPPLREHAEDIPLLIAAFLARFCDRHRRRRKQLSPEALQLCQHFPWPGNVRQLRNTIEQLVVTCHGATIEASQLPGFLQAPDRTVPSFPVHVGMTLAEAERLLIAQTLAQLTSNREKAARALGISRRALQYKLKEYGLLGL